MGNCGRTVLLLVALLSWACTSPTAPPPASAPVPESSLRTPLVCGADHPDAPALS
jgi:hypothetical protein